MQFDFLPALKSVVRPMLKCLKEENFYLPGGWETAHNIGRWWEAALLLQSVAGMKISETIDLAMTIHLRAMTNNPYGLLINDPEIVTVFPKKERDFTQADDEDDTVLTNSRVNFHNLREAMLTYATLLKYRNSRYALSSGEKLLSTIEKCFFDKTLSDKEIHDNLGIPYTTPTSYDPYAEVDQTEKTGRAIEGILLFFQESKSSLALRVLQKAVNFHRTHVINADGSPTDWMEDPVHIGHNHSYLGTLRGLLLYAIAFDDSALAESIYRTYCNTVVRYSCDATGFAPHDLTGVRFADEYGDPLGDHASCADATYLAFLLATKCGHPELLTDVERWIRSRLFFSQQDSGEKEGAWGIYKTYYGKSYTVDVFTSIATTLCRIYSEILEDRDNGIYVHLHFSAENPLLKVSSVRGERQSTAILPHCSKTLHVFLPTWCDEEKVSVTDLEGQPIPFTLKDSYVVIDSCQVRPEQEIVVSYELPAWESTAKTWVSQKSFRLFWKGDTLLRVEESPSN